MMIGLFEPDAAPWNIDRIPDGFHLGDQANAGFITHPDVYTGIVASVAAVAGASAATAAAGWPGGATAGKTGRAGRLEL